MKHFRQFAGIILFLSLSFSYLHAQDLGDLTKARMDFIFEHLDKDKVETGLLSDYGCLWTEPYAYNGVLTDTNYVCMETWKSLYLSMYTTRINNKVTLKEPQLVFNSLRDDAPALLCMQYNRLDENAVNNGLLRFENEQLWETGRSGSPYVKKDLFAVALPYAEYHSQISFIFHQENYISNSRGTPFQLAIRFAPGSAYQPVTWGQPVSHTFTSLGEKEISVRISFNNGKTLESHARIQIIPQPIRYTGGKDIEIPIAATNKHSGGRIQIKYATFNTEKKQLIRPLIIADESDIYKFFENKEINLEYLFGEKNIAEMLEAINKVYDIVYVDNNKGFDDIFRNAQLFEDAMERINNMRGSVHDQSYVIGLGMGGLVASYALRDMENQGKKHDVCKLITINTPHKGFNMPLGLQALIRHIHDIKLAKIFVKDISKEAKKLCKLLDQKAMKQMLIYSIDKTFSYQNDHTEFMQKYEGMGMPTKCRNVAISNGSYLGNNLFQPGGRLFEFYLKKGTESFFWKLILLGNTEIRLDLIADALKSKQSSQVYYGNLYLHKKIIFKYVDINFNKKTLNSTGEMAALDGAPGSKISVKSFFSGDDKLSNAFKQNDFCFVPTVSALGISNWQNKLLSGITLDSETSGFDKLYTTEGNNNYTELAACKDFLLQELAPQIGENNVNIFDNATFTLVNVPSIFKLLAASSLKVDWYLSNDNFKIVSSSKFEVVVAPVKFESSATLKAVLSIQGMDITFETFPVSLKSGRLELTGNKFISPIAERYSLNKIPSGATLSWSYASNLKVIEKKDNYIIIKDISDKGISNPLWIQANLQFEGNIIHRKMDLKRMRIENIELECLQNKMVTINGERKRRFTFRINAFPNDIPDENISYCWSASAFDTSKRGTIQGMIGVKLDIRTHKDACRHLPIEDSITFVTPPLSTFSLSDISFIEPDEYDLEPPFPNYITIFVPMSQSGDSILGTVQAVVRDNYYNFKATQAPIWNYWVSTYRISPNPSNTILNLIQENPQARLLFNYKRSPEIITINLYNNFGLMRSVEADTSQTDIQMNVADLPNGTYYLNILKNGEVIDRQVVMIKH